MTPRIDIDTLILAKGAHDTPDNGVCLLEAAGGAAGGAAWAAARGALAPTVDLLQLSALDLPRPDDHSR